jgi:hypothetical protein
LACGGSNGARTDAAAEAPGSFTWTGQLWGCGSDPCTDTTEAPLPDGQVCAPGFTDIACAEVDAGTWTLVVPESGSATEDIPLLFTSDGFLGAITLGIVGPDAAVFVSPTLYSTDAAKPVLAGEGGFVFPTTATGFVQLKVQGGETLVPAPGVTATIAPSGATAVYDNGSGQLDPAAVSTGSDGIITFGNVPPGLSQITVSAPGMTCFAPGDAVVDSTVGNWSPTGSATVAAQVAAGAMTVGILVVCM